MSKRTFFSSKGLKYYVPSNDHGKEPHNYSLICFLLCNYDDKSHVNGCDDYGRCPTSHITSILHVFPHANA